MCLKTLKLSVRLVCFLFKQIKLNQINQHQSIKAMNLVKKLNAKVNELNRTVKRLKRRVEYSPEEIQVKLAAERVKFAKLNAEHHRTMSVLNDIEPQVRVYKRLLDKQEQILGGQVGGPVELVDGEPVELVDGEPVELVDEEPVELVDEEPVEQAVEVPVENLDNEPVEQAGKVPDELVNDESVEQAVDRKRGRKRKLSLQRTMVTRSMVVRSLPSWSCSTIQLDEDRDHPQVDME